MLIIPAADFLARLPLPGMGKFRRNRGRLDQAIYRMIAEHRAGRRSADDLLSMLLQAADVSHDDIDLRDQVMTLFLAGYETVSNTLTWTWYLLSQNPEIESRLHQELDTVLGGRLPNSEDYPKLCYTEMVLAESMRLYPAAWGMGRIALQEFELGPYRFPERTTVAMSQFIVHRNPEFYPDPLHFDPERFSTEAKAGRPRFSYFPFGGGGRQCIGESFAWMEGVLVLATIAQRWKLRLVDGHPVEPEPLISLRPKYGMLMQAQSRE